MGTMPKEYWETYERKSPHISGLNKYPRLRISCDWALIDQAAPLLGFANGSAVVMELARLAATSKPKFSALVKQLEGLNIERSPNTVRNVRCAEWERAGVAHLVREALFAISRGTNDEGAQ